MNTTKTSQPLALGSTEGLGLLPITPHDHPEPQTMVWSRLELRAIRSYASRCVAAERERWESKAREMAANYRSNGIAAEADGLESLVTAVRGHWA